MAVTGRAAQIASLTALTSSTRSANRWCSATSRRALSSSGWGGGGGLMPKVSQLRTAGELADPEIRREQGRTALAHAVAMRVGYRVDQGLSQSGLARLLGMHQPAIARLEADDHEPSLATLSRLARVLGLEFHIDITPDSFALRDTA
jgi:DNA-binding XRE family transcriptional regulator